MRVSGAEEPGLHPLLLPDDSGEELSRVHVEDGKSSRQGKLPHQGQHSATGRSGAGCPSATGRVASPPPGPCPCPPKLLTPCAPKLQRKETRGLGSRGGVGRGPGICWDEDDGDTREATQIQGPRLTLPAAHPFHHKDAAGTGRHLDCSKVNCVR